MLLAVSVNSYSQTGLKAIQINAAVNLLSGLTVPSGAIVLIGSPEADLTAIKNDTIPCSISIKVYVSVSEYSSGSDPIAGISDFSTYLRGLKMPLAEYTTLSAQDLLIGVVKRYLETIYTGKTEIISL